MPDKHRNHIINLNSKNFKNKMILFVCIPSQYAGRWACISYLHTRDAESPLSLFVFSLSFYWHKKPLYNKQSAHQIKIMAITEARLHILSAGKVRRTPMNASGEKPIKYVEAGNSQSFYQALISTVWVWVTALSEMYRWNKLEPALSAWTKWAQDW